MAKDPAVLFYTADFLVGTYSFTMQERGEYITLLCLQHQQGHLSEDTVRSIASSAAVIDKFLRDPHGRYYNERLDIEKIKRKNFIRSKVENGKKGGRPQKNLNKTYSFPIANPDESDSKATEKLPENENEIDFNTLVINSTKDKSLDQGIKDSTFSFSKATTTTTTTTVGGNSAHARGKAVKNVENLEKERDEDGLLPMQRRIIEKFFVRETGEEPDSIIIDDLTADFIAYNKSRGWYGVGREDVRQDLERYLRRWIDEERAKRSKYQRS